MTDITNSPHINMNDFGSVITMPTTGTVSAYPAIPCCDVSPLPAINHTSSTEQVTKVNNVNKVNPGESNMCEGLIVLGITLLIGYIIGRGFDWKYKITRVSYGYEVWYRPSWWPFWFDYGTTYDSTEAAKKGMEICKAHGKPVEV